MPLSHLLAVLADGKPHHITELAQAAGIPPMQLNALWQQTPQRLRSLLRQKDGEWHLAKPIAMLPENWAHPLFQTHGKTKPANA